MKVLEITLALVFAAIAFVVAEAMSAFPHVALVAAAVSAVMGFLVAQPIGIVVGFIVARLFRRA
jgi:hypothetical protein